MKSWRVIWADIRRKFRPGKQKEEALVTHRREWEDTAKVDLKIRLWWWELHSDYAV
jgi:hypothetical protein